MVFVGGVHKSHPTLHVWVSNDRFVGLKLQMYVTFLIRSKKRGKTKLGGMNKVRNRQKTS